MAEQHVSFCVPPSSQVPATQVEAGADGQLVAHAVVDVPGSHSPRLVVLLTAVVPPEKVLEIGAEWPPAAIALDAAVALPPLAIEVVPPVVVAMPPDVVPPVVTTAGRPPLPGAAPPDVELDSPAAAIPVRLLLTPPAFDGPVVPLGTEVPPAPFDEPPVLAVDMPPLLLPPAGWWPPLQASINPRLCMKAKTGVLRMGTPGFCTAARPFQWSSPRQVRMLSHDLKEA